MINLTQTTYFQLISQFLAALDSSANEELLNKENGILEFIAGDVVMRLSPYLTQADTEPQQIMMEADLMKLNFDRREINHDRFLILHQLNHLSRWTTGIIATISEEGMLTVSKLLPLKDLAPDSLADEVQHLLKAGLSLFESWNQLAESRF